MLQAVTCKTWSCRYCAQIKIKRLAYLTSEAKPNRFITLTTNPHLHKTPLDAWQNTAVRVPELIRHLRTRFGEIEYLRVTELCKNGYPHYHLLLRSAYIPQPVVKAWWHKTTGAEIVDVRKVNNAFNAYWYLVKYLTKLHRLEWTERHVSYSRKFFPEEPELKVPPFTFASRQPLPINPHKVLLRNYLNERVQQVRPGLWFLPHEPMDLQGDPFDSPAQQTNITPPKPSQLNQRTLELTGAPNVYQ